MNGNESRKIASKRKNPTKIQRAMGNWRQSRRKKPDSLRAEPGVEEAGWRNDPAAPTGCPKDELCLVLMLIHNKAGSSVRANAFQFAQRFLVFGVSQISQREVGVLF